jgi:hypothetical protein
MSRGPSGLSTLSAKQAAHIAEAKRALFRAKRGRRPFLPTNVLKQLAAMKLPPDPAIYTKHLQKLLRAEGRY